MMKTIFAVMMLAVSAQAQTSVNFKIKQIVTPEHQVVVEATDAVDLKPGRIFIATFEDRTQCAMSLKSVEKRILFLDSSICKKEAQLSLNTPVEPALLEGMADPAHKEPDNIITQFNKSIFDGRFGFSLSYSTASNLSYRDDARLNQGGGSYNLQDGYLRFKDHAAWGAGVNYSRMNPNSWGFSGALSYESARELRPYSVTSSAVTATGFQQGQELSFFLIEAHILYRWDMIYFPFGGNLSVPFMSDKGDRIHVNPGIGYYAGVGLMFQEHFAIEFFTRSIGFRLKDSSAGTEADFKQVNLVSLGTTLKYRF